MILSRLSPFLQIPSYSVLLLHFPIPFPVNESLNSKVRDSKCMTLVAFDVHVQSEVLRNSSVPLGLWQTPPPLIFPDPSFIITYWWADIRLSLVFVTIEWAGLILYTSI